MAKTIVVIGMGYVGIPAAALFADIDGFQVIGVQRRSKRSGWKIDYINEGKNPIGGNEPGLSELIERVVKAGKFHVTDDISVCKNADVILIDVQTPVDNNKIPRYESLKAVSESIGKYIKESTRKGVLIVIESTVAPGTTEHIVKPILENVSGMRAGEDFYLAYSYERVMVGRLLHNLKNYPRIIGGINEESSEKAIELYRAITDEELFATDPTTAELAKTIENTYRDVNIAFANEMALICENMGANVYEVRKLVNTLPKSSNAYRNMHLPGAGAGGHCLPKDPWLLKYGLDTYGKSKFEPKIIVASRALNDFMALHMAELLESAFSELDKSVEEAKLCILGLAFLENSDDPRNTPTIPLHNKLVDMKAAVIVHDPYITEHAGVELTGDLEIALNGADALLLVTAHDEYRNLDLNHLKELMKTAVIIDGRNVFDNSACAKAGIVYRGIGK